MGWYGLDRSGSGYGPVKGSREHCNLPSGSIKYWEALEYLSLYRFLKNDSAPQI
jgi:hypothetical protein